VLPESVNEVIAHFLTDFPYDLSIRKTEDYVRNYLTLRYTPEVAEEVIAKHYSKIASVLIEEYDHRYQNRDLLRYRFVDATGDRVQGIGVKWKKQHRIFQDALNCLTDSDFEALSARVLGVLGCDEVWFTPASHDQGLDSFGYSIAFRRSNPREIHAQCRMVFLAQAKHYKKYKIGSRDIREFVGSAELAVHKIFSTVDQRYAALRIKPFGPTVMVFMTTQEIPRTVKTMGQNFGIVVLSAQDIGNALSKAGVVNKSRWTQTRLAADMKRSLRGIARAS